MNSPSSPACAPAENGMTWNTIPGRLPSLARWSSWAWNTAAPPTGRRSTPSSTTAHNIGGLGRSRIRWRSTRAATTAARPRSGAGPAAGVRAAAGLMRNATMSGYGLATLVVEAGEHSGARVQARLAVEHGRPVILTDLVVERNA